MLRTKLFFVFFTLAFSINLARSADLCRCKIQPDNWNHLIIGGKQAHHNAYPWLVSIANDGFDITHPARHRVSTKYKISNSICGGTILNEYWVMTAAHCVDKPFDDRNAYAVGFGNYNDKVRMFDSGRIRVRRVHLHPGYNRTHFLADDIALLQLEEPIKFTETVQPGCLGVFQYNKYRNQNRVLKVAGFGSTNFYKEDKKTKKAIYFKQNETTRYLKEAEMRDVSDYAYRCRYDRTKLCVDNLVPDESICYGDSGSPIHFTLRNGRSFVLGPASSVEAFSIREDRDYHYFCKGPASYQRLTPYIDWLQSFLGGNYCDDYNE